MVNSMLSLCTHHQDLKSKSLKPSNATWGLKAPSGSIPYNSETESNTTEKSHGTKADGAVRSPLSSVQWQAWPQAAETGKHLGNMTKLTKESINTYSLNSSICIMSVSTAPWQWNWIIYWTYTADQFLSVSAWRRSTTQGKEKVAQTGTELQESSQGETARVGNLKKIFRPSEK